MIFEIRVLITSHSCNQTCVVAGHISVEKAFLRLLLSLFAMPTQRPNTSRRSVTHCVLCGCKFPCFSVKVLRKFPAINTY